MCFVDDVSYVCALWARDLLKRFVKRSKWVDDGDGGLVVRGSGGIAVPWLR